MSIKTHISNITFLPLKGVGGSIREDKLYSVMYILGAAMAIAFTMIIAEVYYIKVANIAPEVNRSKTYYLNYYLTGGENYHSENFSYQDFTDLFQKMKTPECVIAETGWTINVNLQLGDNLHERNVSFRTVEPGYWRFFKFNFTEGAAFTQDDFDNKRPYAVITEEIRDQVFGKEGKAVGKIIKLNFKEYKVCGVVETPSALTEKSKADIWFPLSCYKELCGIDYESLSHYQLSFCVPDSKRDAFIQELKEAQARFNTVNKDRPIDDITTDLKSYYAEVLEHISYMLRTWKGDIYFYLLPAILILLLVPALNLSGMVASRMEHRLPEMGIRKAFGAKRRTLLGQVIMENLTLTLIGGAVGLCLAWVALYGWRDWVFDIFSYDYNNNNGAIPILKGEMLFGPVIFLIALLACTILNILAATLPAWFSLRKPIVESMMLRK